MFALEVGSWKCNVANLEMDLFIIIQKTQQMDNYTQIIIFTGNLNSIVIVIIMSLSCHDKCYNFFPRRHKLVID